jgi:hypothetical protein
VLMLVMGCGPSATGEGDAGGGDDDASGGPDTPISNVDAPACAAEDVAASEVVRPVDILWVIDNSGSMDEEEARIQDNMNTFAATIGGSGVDYHVVVVTDTGHVNVPPPLNPGPRFLGVNVSIGSTNALERLVQTYPMYQSFLRADSVKHIVVVTDDESDWSRATFESQLAALPGPGFGTDWRFHAIVAEAPPWDFNSHCFLLAADIGAIYIQLQTAHNGLFFSLCDTNWTPLFTTLGQEVTQGLSLPCTFDIPEPPIGQTLDPTLVNFVYTPTGGAPITIPNVGSMASCSGDGWYYDDPVNPTQILVCPALCTTLENDATGSVSVEFGCETIVG